MKTLLPTLYTIVSVFAAPFNEGFLQVDEMHQLYFAEYGNPEGVPVVVLHGGPGFGCSPKWVSSFDESYYRIIMFDQRGAGRSKPHAEMRNNTPQHSVADIEMLREHLDVDQWLVFGGSWGSTLALLYGEAHPERVTGFVLRGVFLVREQDYRHLFDGMKLTQPEAWYEMLETVGLSTHDDLLSAFHKLVMSPDASIALKAAHAFMKFDMICATMLPNHELVRKMGEDDCQALGTARNFIHFAANHFFIKENQLLENLDRITHLPVVIVQGRHDTITPPIGAYQLHKAWPDSKLWMIPDAGHSSGEPEIAKALRRATDLFKL